MPPFNNVGQAFGLVFRCSHVLPELTPHLGEDPQGSVVDIVWRQPAPARPAGPREGAPFHASGDRFHFQMPGIAAFTITAARITVTPEPGADDRSIRAFLFGSAIGALLYLRDLTVLHGSAVAMPDGSAAVFCGLSTAGKSTLAAALAGRGHAALADDITAVRFDAKGNAWCLPGLARTKLWRDALDTLGLADRASADTRVMPHLDKHSLSLAMGDAPAPLSRFYELQVREDGALTFDAVTGVEKVTLMLAHAYRPAYVQAMGLQPALLRRAAMLARQLKVEQIVRPRHQPTLAAIVARLEQQWSQ